MKINQKLEVHDGRTVVVPPAIKITYEFALTMVNEAVFDAENPKLEKWRHIYSKTKVWTKIMRTKSRLIQVETSPLNTGHSEKGHEYK